jgi:hypothetical protein
LAAGLFRIAWFNRLKGSVATSLGPALVGL